MSIEEMLVEKLNVLPPAKQQELLAFAESLVKEAQATQKATESEKSARLPLSELLKDTEVVGMWRDRPEMQDSTAWVRQLRQQQWRAENLYDSDR
ncbi:hypothetical protein LEP3755_57820 [Leptolyngbya sp. NIES-3755]|nr:hypothetical protein LEP3755_57820 [Leptolyngbya sp. NIES-3755]